MDTAAKIKKINLALEALCENKQRCGLCPRECSVNRDMEWGYCSSGREASLSHVGLHFGEEPVLIGHENCSKKQTKNSIPKLGSGTIFFSGCHLKCLHCQNYQISWNNQGNKISNEELAVKMLELQKKGALNINLVSPTHMLLPILSALKMAYQKGLFIPLVYNSSGYEKDSIIKKLDGIIDLYLPDLKYRSPQLSKKLSGVSNYFKFAKSALLEMSTQQPELILNQNSIAQKGLIIRHLVIPGKVQDTINILKWIKQNISNSFGLSLMSQFYPCFKTPPEFQKKVTPNEYEKAVNAAQKLGFECLYVQPELFSDNDHLIPDFKQKSPFTWE